MLNLGAGFDTTFWQLKEQVRPAILCTVCWHPASLQAARRLRLSPWIPLAVDALRMQFSLAPVSSSVRQAVSKVVELAFQHLHISTLTLT